MSGCRLLLTGEPREIWAYRASKTPEYLSIAVVFDPYFQVLLT